MHNRQRGMSMWSAMFVIGVAVFAILVFFKLFPPYMESMTVKRILEGAAAQGPQTRDALINVIGKRMITEDVPTDLNLQRDLKLEKRGTVTVARISYEVVVPMFYNISVLLNFEFEKELKGFE